jgi:hypothetical protein
VVNWRLELTHEDYLLREKRRQERQDGELAPSLLPWHESFVKRLSKCPLCGEMPRINAMWRPKYGYSYKIECPNDCGMINCGDWYDQLSRAGLDWNYRTQEAAGMPHKHCPHWKGKM